MAAIANAKNPPIVAPITTQVNQTTPAIDPSNVLISNFLRFDGQSRFTVLVDRRGVSTSALRVSVRVRGIPGLEFNLFEGVWPGDQEVFFATFHTTGVNAWVRIQNIDTLNAYPAGMQIALFGSSGS